MRMRAKYVSVEHASAVGVDERWRSQYQRDGKWWNSSLGTSEEIHRRLVALGRVPDIAAVADIIGNKSWSYISCDGCSDYVEKAVRLGAEYSDGKVFCMVCIAEANHAINETAT